MKIITVDGHTFDFSVDGYGSYTLYLYSGPNPAYKIFGTAREMRRWIKEQLKEEVTNESIH